MIMAHFNLKSVSVWGRVNSGKKFFWVQTASVSLVSQDSKRPSYAAIGSKICKISKFPLERHDLSGGATRRKTGRKPSELVNHDDQMEISTQGTFIYDVRFFWVFLTYLPTHPNQMVYYIGLFSKIRCSLTYLPTQKSDIICSLSN